MHVTHTQRSAFAGLCAACRSVLREHTLRECPDVALGEQRRFELVRRLAACGLESLKHEALSYAQLERASRW